MMKLRKYFDIEWSYFLEKIVEVGKKYWSIQEELYSDKFTIIKEGSILVANIHLKKQRKCE